MRKTVVVAAVGAALVARGRRHRPAPVFEPFTPPVQRRSLHDLVSDLDDDSDLVIAEQEAQDEHILHALDLLVRRVG